jgi:hypothetical protein
MTKQFFEISGELKELCLRDVETLRQIERGYISDLSAKTGQTVKAVLKEGGMFCTWTPCAFLCDRDVDGMKVVDGPNYRMPNRRTKAGRKWDEYLRSMPKIVEFKGTLEALGVWGKAARSGNGISWAGIHRAGDRFFLLCPINLVTPEIAAHPDLRAMTPLEVEAVSEKREVAS